MAKGSELKLSLDHKTIRELLEDSEFLIEVKTAILRTALKEKTFKFVASEMTKAMEQAIVKEVENQIGSWKSENYKKKLVVNAALQTELSNMVTDKLTAYRESLFSVCYTEHIKAFDEYGGIEAYVDKLVATRVNEKLRVLVMAKVDNIIDAALAVPLNL